VIAFLIANLCLDFAVRENVTPRDRDILRELAKRYVEVCADREQPIRRDLWRRHNSLKPTRPLIYVRAFAWQEMPESRCRCEDARFHPYENFLRYQLFWASLGDDSIFEPWVTVPAARRCEGWGVDCARSYSEDARGAYKVDYPIKHADDLARLRMPWHEIDEPRTAELVGLVEDAIGDIITINVDRAPLFRMHEGDIANDLGYLRGIENIMLDMVDNPEWLHRLVKFMSDGILRVHDQAEEAGDWNMSAHESQAMSYAEELDDPAPNVNGVKRNRLWAFAAAQEFTGISPAMHDAFLLQYQLPILRKFGLVAYGCCEDLTRKIDILRQIPNLRRIAVAPAANVARCAEQIGPDYVLSYRPSPTEMVGIGFDPEWVRTVIRKDLAACRGCHVDITLKDVETVQGDPDRVRQWARLVREEVERG
jgi:hypothetical protein